ncbi:MAG: type II secretion system protein [Candidatus Puniceispirillaceae bacterium]
MAETRTGNRQQIASLSGFSLLETLIAVSLLAFVASVAVHMMITTQDSASQS